MLRALFKDLPHGAHTAQTERERGHWGAGGGPLTPGSSLMLSRAALTPFAEAPPPTSRKLAGLPPVGPGAPSIHTLIPRDWRGRENLFLPSTTSVICPKKLLVG